jgi:hypothetical protein
MHCRSLVVILIAAATSCTTGAPRPAVASRPPIAQSVAPPRGGATCDPLPKGLTLYGGIAFADVEKAGRLAMQLPERQFLETNNHLWVHFREDLRPTDLIFEYAYDDEWEDEGKFYTMHSGGLTAFRDGCPVRTEQVWTT